jgi:hypothetical protein
LLKKNSKGLEFELAPSSRAEVGERVKLQLYFSGASQNLLGCTLYFTFCAFICLIYRSR